MANKLIVYVLNPNPKPKDMDQVINFGKEHSAFRVAEVGNNAFLADKKVGDCVVSHKGSHCYIVKTSDKVFEESSQEFRDYVDTLMREYNCKKSNISSVANTIKYETWCQYAKPLINKSNSKTMVKNSTSNFLDRFKSMFMPTEANDVRIAMDGNICVATEQGYVAINAQNQLMSYPEELTINLPVYIICKPKEQLQVGDVIARERSYAKITKINGDKISAIGYTGAATCIHTIKDVLFNQTMVRVVVSLAGSLGNSINPMMLLAMSGKEDRSNLLPLMMMNQQGGALGMNPMMLMMMTGDNNFDMKDMLLMSAMGGGNMFGNMFVQPAPQPAQPVPQPLNLQPEPVPAENEQE